MLPLKILFTVILFSRFVLGFCFRFFSRHFWSCANECVCVFETFGVAYLCISFMNTHYVWYFTIFGIWNLHIKHSVVRILANLLCLCGMDAIKWAWRVKRNRNENETATATNKESTRTQWNGMAWHGIDQTHICFALAKTDSIAFSDKWIHSIRICCSANAQCIPILFGVLLRILSFNITNLFFLSHSNRRMTNRKCKISATQSKFESDLLESIWVYIFFSTLCTQCLLPLWTDFDCKHVFVFHCVNWKQSEREIDRRREREKAHELFCSVLIWFHLHYIVWHFWPFKMVCSRHHR